MARASEAGGRSHGKISRRSRYRQLKPRPGHSGTAVAEHQRARIHAATIDLVDEHGYRALTVTGIARAAGISSRTFYENFADKEECFLATYDLIVRHTARAVLAARNRESDWRAKLQAGFLAFAREVAEKPKAARLALLEALVAGTANVRMRHTNGLFETLVADSFASGSGSVDLPPLVAKGIVAGATRVARARLLAGEEGALSADADELTQWALSLYSNAAADVCPGWVDFAPATSPPPFQTEGRRSAQAGADLVSDERTMILSAVAQIGARDGYGALTIPRIRTVAGVSRRRFEAHFEGVTDCFLAALELLSGRLIAKARSAYRSADVWPNGIHRALAVACQEIADDPALVNLVFLELFASGRDGVRWRADLIANLSSLMRGRAPAEIRPTAVAAEASTGAALAVLRHYAATGRAQQLPAIAGTASYMILAPAIGADAAAEVIHAETTTSAGASEYLLE